MFSENMRSPILLLALMAGLSACGGGSSSSAPAPQPPAPQPAPEPTSPPDVNPPQAFSGGLVRASEDMLGRYLKNGIFSSVSGQAPVNSPTPVPSADVAQSTESFASNRISSTNTQESGVDEADRMEYDGNYLYLAANPEWFEVDAAARVRVLQRNQDFTLEQVNELTFSGEDKHIQGIYLGDQRLAMLATDFSVHLFTDIAIEPWLPPEQKVTVGIFDTSAPATAASMFEAEIDGWLMASRRIDDQLYLVTSYVPHVDRIDRTGEAEELAQQNYQTIQDVPVADLMPKMHIDGQATALNDPQDCFIPAQATDNDGYAQLLTVTRINLQQPQDIESLCMSVYAFTLYMSQDNLYLASDMFPENSTGFHKIALTGLSYQASGDVPGTLGWRGAVNLRLDEEQGYLRVVSTDYSGAQPAHRLTVLEQNETQLEAVVSLPNDVNPEPIGKPGEDIFAVRFVGDKGYIVTFEQIDPLYVVDFPEPDKPELAGSLEIPGFSSYLHPMDNGYLLGVGQQVNTGRLPENGETPIENPVVAGMKVSLFDVRDPAQPKELNAIVKEQGYTPVEYDYKALTFTHVEGKYQFALPLEEWGNAQGNGEFVESLLAARASLLLLEADTAASSPSLIEVDQLKISDPEVQYVGAGNDRSVIHGEHVYYIHGNQVWHAQWHNQQQLDGPY